MDYFEEESVISSVSYSCCGVCENQPEDVSDRQEEVVTVLRAVQEISGNGEVKVHDLMNKCVTLITNRIMYSNC